jgi:sulfur-carrier protein
MKVNVKYFGMIADLTGKGSENLEIAGQGRSLDMRAMLLAKYPGLANMSWKLAVDQEIVEGSCDVHESSEIVLLPPFAGG